MEHPVIPPMPQQYYRKHAARIRALAQEATTIGIKEHLRAVALELLPNLGDGWGQAAA
jgi:hypothetical protein